MKKRGTTKKAIVFLTATAIGVIFIRFILSLWGETVMCEYVFAQHLSVLGQDFALVIYSFTHGIPFFGISIAHISSLGRTISYIPFFPLISGESDIVYFDWGEAGVLTIAIIVLIGFFCFRGGETEQTELTEEEASEKEEALPDKDACPKCGKKIFGENVYCENCGARRPE